MHASFISTGEVIEACPFCGSNHLRVFEVDAQVWAVYCTDCESVGRHASGRKHAIDRWGKRP